MLQKDDGLLIGDCRLERMEVDGEAEVELGYDMRSDFWNRGLATEVASAVRDYAFDRLRLPRLISLIRQGNLPSRRVAEKVGLRQAGALTRHGHAYWRYALGREEWVAAASPPAE